jgi:nitrogen fixation/metabolism regulation signal transduction histidine kinase
LVGVLPGALIYVVSYQFVSRSIESWFDVRVEGALTSGLNLGRTTIDMLRADTSRRVGAAAQELASAQMGAYTLQLSRLREQLQASEVSILSTNGQVIASASESSFSLSSGVSRPTASQMAVARAGAVSVQVLGLDGESEERPALQVLTFMSSTDMALRGESHFLSVLIPLPPTLVADALAVQEANRDYQERSLARDGLRRMYIGTLTLTLFLSVFGAVLVAALLGTQLVQPLLLLAAGVRDVAKGDLTPKLIVDTRDELGGLTRSFADMTQQLADARGGAGQCAPARRCAGQSASYPG